MTASSPASPPLLRHVQFWLLCLVVILVMTFEALTLGATDFRDKEDLAEEVAALQENRGYRTLPLTLRHYFRVLLSSDYDDFTIGRKRLAHFLIDPRYDSSFLRWYIETKLDLFVPVNDQVDLLANFMKTREGRNLWEISEKRFNNPVSRLDHLQFLEAAILMYDDKLEEDKKAYNLLLHDFAYRLQNLNMWPPPDSWTNDQLIR